MHSDDLGLAVALGDRHADAVEPAQQVGVHGRRAAGHDAGVVEAELAADRPPDDAVEDLRARRLRGSPVGGRPGSRREVALGEAAGRRRAGARSARGCRRGTSPTASGTANRIVGRQARRSSASVAMPRANHVSAPPTIWPKLLIERSVMWLSGRNDKKRSSGQRSINDVRLRIVAITLAWVIMVPLGGPVVPLV